MAAISKKQMAIKQRGKARINEYRKDWCLFAREVLGVKLDREQEEILRSVQVNPRTSVVSGTARGKDFVAAVCAICFLVLTARWNASLELEENTKVALTAPTDRQVKNIMMPEIARIYNRAKRRCGELIPGGRLTAYDIRTANEEWFLTGFKADENNHEAWSGFHAVHTMFVVTEASGISDNTFDAIEGNLQGDSRILLVFNPNTTVGYAARSQKGERWRKFRLNSLTAPNILQHRIVIPGQVDYAWIQDKLENWCERIQEEDRQEELDDFCFEGQWYRPEDLFRKKVLGKFPKVADDVLIPQQWIELANQRWKEAGGREPINHEQRMMGVDVAGMGRDCSCFVERQGAWCSPFDRYNSGGRADHMRLAGMVTDRRNHHPDMFVMIDTIGEGAGVFSRCQETDRDPDMIVSCKYSESGKKDDSWLTDITGQYTFRNMRAYLFWCVRDWLNPRNNTGAMLPPDDKLLEEATEIRWSFMSDGRIYIEPKEDIKKRIGRSPDSWDALANTFYPVEPNRRIDLRRLGRLV